MKGLPQTLRLLVAIVGNQELRLLALNAGFPTSLLLTTGIGSYLVQVADAQALAK